MSIHRMDVELRADLGKIIYTCAICERCVEVDRNDGGFKVLARGDQHATHRGGALSDMDLEVEAKVEADRSREPPRRLH